MKLRDIAELVQSKGQDGDVILAHINPHEANELAVRYGYDINPYTGLPQFGKFGRILKKAFHPIQQVLHSKIVKSILPLVGSIAGAVVGGPAGGALGGAVGRAITRRDNVGKNLLKGGLLGGAVGFGGQMLGGMGGAASGGGGLGSIFGRGAAGIGGRLAGMGAMGGAAGALGGAGAAAGGGGILSGLMGSLGGPLNAGLLGASLAGMLGRKERVGRDQIRQEQQDVNSIRNLPTYDMSVANPQKWGPEDQYRKVKPHRRKYIKPPENYVAGVDPEFDIFPEENEEIQYYREGGYVHGHDGGQSDKIPVKLRPHSYVMDATTVSLLGDGNSLKGKKIIEKELEKKFSKSNFEKSGIIRNPKESKKISAYVSSGEHIVKPEIVINLGKGSVAKGVKILDKTRDNLRKHKGVKTFLPPKSKKLTEYMR